MCSMGEFLGQKTSLNLHTCSGCQQSLCPALPSSLSKGLLMVAQPEVATLITRWKCLFQSHKQSCLRLGPGLAAGTHRQHGERSHRRLPGHPLPLPAAQLSLSQRGRRGKTQDAFGNRARSLGQIPLSSPAASTFTSEPWRSSVQLTVLPNHGPVLNARSS